MVASSTERMRVLELIEVQNDEGPCRDCARDGGRVLNQRLDDVMDKWPRFAPKAREAGFQVVHALPLRLRADVIGAMNIFSADLRDLSAIEVDLAQALADVATIGILQERAVAQGTHLASQLQDALNSRVVIEQAKGIVAERLKVEMDEAFAILRGYARGHRRRLRDVATDLIGGTLSAAGLAAAHAGQEGAAEKRPPTPLSG